MASNPNNKRNGIRVQVGRDNANTAGWVIGNRFENERTHWYFLKNPPALAFSQEAVETARALGASEIQITITDASPVQVWTCTMPHFLEYAIPIQRGKWEPQYALTLDRWTKSLHVQSRAAGPGQIVFTPARKPKRRNLMPAGAARVEFQEKLF